MRNQVGLSGGQASGSGRRAFTLVEMLVAISVIVFLAAIALPALGRARESARDKACRSNLRQLGAAIVQYGDSHTTYCSGAFDWKRDGCFTEVGWVADLVRQGTPVGALMCPSSLYPLSETYNQMLAGDMGDPVCVNSAGRKEVVLPDGKKIQSPCRTLASGGDKPTIVNEQVLQTSFNTNYVASWFFVRTDLNIDTRGRLVGEGTCPSSTLDRSGTLGPLIKAYPGTGKVQFQTIPLLACGNAADIRDGVLTESVGEHAAGARLAESFTDGPVTKNTMRAPAAGASWQSTWRDTLQDYRDFGPVHGGQSGSCNILFLDGSVRSFNDTNGDGYLNNGFPTSAANGFQDDEVELPPTEVYSGWSLNAARMGNN